MAQPFQEPERQSEPAGSEKDPGDQLIAGQSCHVLFEPELQNSDENIADYEQNFLGDI